MQIKYVNSEIVPISCVKFPQSDDRFRVAKMIAIPTVRGSHNLSDALPKENNWLGSKRLWLRSWKAVFLFALSLLGVRQLDLWTADDLSIFSREIKYGEYLVSFSHGISLETHSAVFARLG